jgi:hypothetical protein
MISFRNLFYKKLNGIYKLNLYHLETGLKDCSKHLLCGCALVNVILLFLARQVIAFCYKGYQQQFILSFIFSNVGSGKIQPILD